MPRTRQGLQRLWDWMLRLPEDLVPDKFALRATCRQMRDAMPLTRSDVTRALERLARRGTTNWDLAGIFIAVHAPLFTQEDLRKAFKIACLETEQCHLIRILLTIGITVDFVRADGVLEYAASLDNMGVVKVLLQHVRGITAKDVRAANVLRYACMWGSNGSIETVDLLMAIPGGVTIEDLRANDRSVLRTVANFGRNAILKRLLTVDGVDASDVATPVDGWGSPLFLAASNGRLGTVKLMLNIPTMTAHHVRASWALHFLPPGGVMQVYLQQYLASVS